MDSARDIRTAEQAVTAAIAFAIECHECSFARLARAIAERGAAPEIVHMYEVDTLGFLAAGASAIATTAAAAPFRERMRIAAREHLAVRPEALAVFDEFAPEIAAIDGASDRLLVFLERTLPNTLQNRFGTPEAMAGTVKLLRDYLGQIAEFAAEHKRLYSLA